MKVTSETTDTREVVLTIEPDPNRIAEAKRKTAGAMSRWRPVPGFRPGRAPLAMVERIFGADTVLNEAVNSIANELFQEAAKEAEIEPFEPGEFEVESQDPVLLKVKVALQPKVGLGDYRALRIAPEPEVVVSDAEVDAEIEQLRDQHATFEPVAGRPAIHTDRVVVNLVARVDGEVAMEEDNQEYELTPDLEPMMLMEAILGMEIGEEKETRIDFSDEYPDDRVTGKSTQLTITLVSVMERVLPEVDDEFAKDVDHESVAAMRDSIRTRMQSEREAQAADRERQAAVEALVAASTIEYPRAAVEREVQNTLDNEKSRLQNMGFTWENYLRIMRQTEDQLRESVRPNAEKRLVQRLAVSEFAQAEELEVGPGEVMAEVDRLAANYGERADEVRQRILSSGAVMSIHGDLLGRKALERLVAMLTGREIDEAESANAVTTDSEAAEAAGEPEGAGDEPAGEEPGAEETVAEEPTEDAPEA